MILAVAVHVIETLGGPSAQKRIKSAPHSAPKALVMVIVSNMAHPLVSRFRGYVGCFQGEARCRERDETPTSSRWRHDPSASPSRGSPAPIRTRPATPPARSSRRCPAHLRGGDRGRARGRGRSGDAAGGEHDLWPRGRHPPAAARIGPAHRRRGLRARAHQPARRARRDDRRCDRGVVASRPAAAMRRFLREHGITGRVSPDNARAARDVAERATRRRPRSPRNWRARSTGSTCWPAISRITTPTPRASSSCRARPT
jgi:hypothetical protein